MGEYTHPAKLKLKGLSISTSLENSPPPIRAWFRPLLAGAVFIALAGYIWHARHQLVVVFQIDWRYLIPMIMVPLASLAVNGLIGRELAAQFGVKLSPMEWYGLAVVNSLGNYLPLPQAGAMARGMYLKRVHSFPYLTYTATLVVTYVSAIALYGVLGLIGLVTLSMLGRPSPIFLWIIFAMLTGSLALFTPLSRFLPVPRRMADLRIHLQSLRRQHLLLRIILLQMLLVALTTTGLWLACHTLPNGNAVNWPVALMLGLMILASGIVNVTPGNVGIEQGMAELSARVLHIAPNVGFLGSALFRAVAVVTILAIGPLFTTALAKRQAAGH